MNHLLKSSSTASRASQIPDYTDSASPICDELVSCVIEFIMALNR
ncbi:MAG: hypothetical protein ACRC10_02755 [Thermoguttaceae bacterium]